MRGLSHPKHVQNHIAWDDVHLDINRRHQGINVCSSATRCVENALVHKMAAWLDCSIGSDLVMTF